MGSKKIPEKRESKNVTPKKKIRIGAVPRDRELYGVMWNTFGNILENSSAIDKIIQDSKKFDAGSLKDEYFTGFAERILSILQYSKSIGCQLQELTRPKKPVESKVTLRDTSISREAASYDTTYLWTDLIEKCNKSILEDLDVFLGDGEERTVSLIVDTFSEELEQIRQSEEMSPTKLEVLVESLQIEGNLLSRIISSL